MRRNRNSDNLIIVNKKKKKKNVTSSGERERDRDGGGLATKRSFFNSGTWSFCSLERITSRILATSVCFKNSSSKAYFYEVTHKHKNTFLFLACVSLFSKEPSG